MIGSSPAGSVLTAKGAVVGWVVAYVAVLMWSTSILIAPLFGYYGYVPRSTSIAELLIAIQGTLIVALLLPAQCRRASDVAVLFLTVTVAIPLLWIPLRYGPLDSTEFVELALCITGAFFVMWLCLRGTRHPFVIFKVPEVVFWVLMAGFCALAVGYLFAQGVAPTIVSFSDVYTQRDAFKAGIDTLGAYLVGWLSGGTFPIVLSVGIYRRNKTLIVAGIVGTLFLYGLTGQKSYVLGLPILVGTYVMTRRGSTKSWHWLGLLSLVIAFVALVDRLRGGFEITSLLVRRGITTAGINTAFYVDLFNGAPLYGLRHSVLSMLGSPPYDVPPAILVGNTYYSDGTVANANFLADGFANFGWLGILGAGLVAGLLLRVYDRVSADLPLGITAPALVFILQAVANTAILTTVATHGFGVLIGWMALLPASVAVAQRRVSSPDPAGVTAEVPARGRT